MSQRHYNKAPIVEAIIDIQTHYKELPHMDQFKICNDQLSSKFPNSNPIKIFEMGLSPNEDTEPKFNHSQAEVGLRLSTEKNDRILQLQHRGFTYSHMAPYTDWTNFSSEGKAYWETFLEVCKPESVTRCAVRFINRINIPKKSIKISDYFNIFPNVPDNFSKEINGMLLQLQTALTDLASDAKAVTNFAMTNPDSPDSVTIVLDFDLFCTTNFDPHSSEIWDTLKMFRDRKNDLFESCITDEVRRLIS